MDPITIGAAISVAGGIANFFANKSANERAQMLQDQAFQQWFRINIPNPEEQRLALQQFVVAGVLNPQLEKAIKADPSAFEKIVSSSQHKGAQNRALRELEDIGYKGGLRLQDKAAIQDAMLEGQTRERGGRQAIASDMARRGLSSSGYEVASQLQGQQGVADQEANSRLKTAAMAQDRALQSIMGAGDLATKYRTQDFSEQAQKASAADRINMFNTENLRDVQQRNIGSLNRASELNLAQKQRTSDQNTQLNNYEQQYNRELLQKRFENETRKAQGMSGIANQSSQTLQQGGQNAGNMFSNLAGAGLGYATAAGNQDFWDNYFKKKKDSNYDGNYDPELDGY